MAYQPFVRGTLPVTRRTVRWHDDARQRMFEVDLHLPLTTSSFADQRRFEVNSHPVVIFAHGWYGQRTECAGLCTHLASHGYRVVCADFPGTTQADVAKALGEPDFNFERSWEAIATARLADMPFLIEAAAGEFGELLKSVGVIGSSLGGWTALMAPAVDPRVRAVVAMCPMGGAGPLTHQNQPILGGYLTFNWAHPVAVTCLVADRDSWLPLYGQIETYSRIPGSDKHMIVLRRADHLHFVDDVTESHASFAAFTLALDNIPGAKGIPWRAMANLISDGAMLMPETQAQIIVRGMVTLQMDAALQGLQIARSALANLGQEFLSRRLDAYSLHGVCPLPWQPGSG